MSNNYKYQCQQCPMVLYDKKAADDHLDWHFRDNMQRNKPRTQYPKGYKPNRLAGMCSGTIPPDYYNQKNPTDGTS